MLDPDVQSANPRVIKRYANRKLYDTRSSRYVTLPQIAELVRGGEDVQIIDNRTKENLTAQLREGPVGRFMPKAELPDLSALRDSPRRVVAPAVEALEELHRRADEKMRTLIGGVIAPLRELAHEVARLQARIEDLEARLTNWRERGSETRGAADKPAETKGVETKPAETKPAETPPDVDPHEP
jgi:hypothetical protein